MKNLTDYWNERADKETLEKQVQLDNLKAAKSKDFERYQALAKKVKKLFTNENLLQRKLINLYKINSTVNMKK